MAEWQQLLQSVFIGLIFSYLLAKLISIVVSFKEENLSISRNINIIDDDDDATATASSSSSSLVPESKPNSESIAAAAAAVVVEGGDSGRGGVFDEVSSRVSEEGSMVAEMGSVGHGGDDEDDGDGDDEEDEDDDWEGVESTELDEAFSAATAFVAAAAADRLSQKVSNDVQLQLYGLYKIATEGPCSTPQPSALKMTARAKWQAWQKMGTMPPEDAMQKYIELVTELYPTWLAGSTNKRRAGDSIASSADAKGPMGPVFSTFVYEEESGTELKMDAIHAFAREGEVENLLNCIESGVPVNVKDSEGRTPLHWAVDRGHLKVAELLISRNADVNAKDDDGQTPLHYAAVCEREAMAEFLVKHDADTNAKDDDGNSPYTLCDSKWSWMHSMSK